MQTFNFRLSEAIPASIDLFSYIEEVRLLCYRIVSLIDFSKYPILKTNKKLWLEMFDVFEHFCEWIFNIVLTILRTTTRMRNL